MLFFLFLAWRDLVVSCCLGSNSREAQGLAREALWQRLATGLKLACSILQQTCGDK